MFSSYKITAPALLLGCSALLFGAERQKGNAEQEIARGSPAVETGRPKPRATEKCGPAAALDFARGYRGEAFTPGVLYCYPDAAGIPFDDTENILAMSEKLWTPAQLTADFNRRMAVLPQAQRKKGIIVLLKTERCAPKIIRACTVTTAALEKRSTPLAADFLIYGVWLKPRDNDNPPGSLKIETDADAWKNDAAGEYAFTQGPGATLAFIDPATGKNLSHSNALQLGLWEKEFLADEGRTPKLEAKLREILGQLRLTK